MLIAHGGGGFAGSVEQSGPLAAWYSKILGVKTFDVEYRLAPEAKQTQMIGDFYQAIKYVYQNNEILGVDKNKIAIQGCSGGGYVVTCVSGMLAQLNESYLVKLLIAE